MKIRLAACAQTTAPGPSIFLHSISNAMYENVLTRDQHSLALKLLPGFKDFYLCGGTAIALQTGYRKSIDFDLATPGSIHSHALTRKILKSGLSIEHTMVTTGDELSIVVNGIKLTFFSFPFEIPANKFWDTGQIKMPDLLTLGGMKAYALGRRCKWKDYVDLYFLLKKHFKLPTLIDKSEKIFKGSFNSKLFLEQLCYFDDIDMTEQVEFVDQAVKNVDIRLFLTDTALLN